MIARLTSLAGIAALALTATPGLTQTAPAPPPAPGTVEPTKVGDFAATFAELINAVDLCRRATNPRARFDYRLLRDAGYGIGSRKWEQPAGAERGELVWAFGKGNVAMFVRHGATSVNCKVVAQAGSPEIAVKVRDEILARKWAKPFDEGAPPELRDSMRKKYPNNDFKNILVGDSWLFGIDQSKNSAGRELVSIQVNALGAPK